MTCKDDRVGTEDVLAALATGLWRWDNASGRSHSTARPPAPRAAPAEPVVLPEVAVRSRFHPVDWNEINGIVTLAVAEGTLAEARLRITDEDGRVPRTVRSRSKPLEDRCANAHVDHELIGTLDAPWMRPTARGLPLGIVPETDYPTTRFTLEPGGTMCCARVSRPQPRGQTPGRRRADAERARADAG